MSRADSQGWPPDGWEDATPGVTTHRELASEIIAGWAQGVPADARAALKAHPELRAAKSVVLDLAYEEYCRRKDAGGPPDLDAFCERFPTFKTSLRRLIEAHRFLEESSWRPGAGKAGAWPEPGEVFQGFYLHRLLGRGAFARVFLATEAELGDRAVVLKVSRHGSAEAATLGRLRHENIVPVYSVRQDPDTGLTAVVMPYLGSATLCDVLDHAFAGPPPTHARVILEAARAALPADDPAPDRHPPEPLLERGSYVDGVVLLAARLADALARTHERRVLHRDLKPSNILLTPDGRPMLLDFNLSFDEQGTGQHLGGTLPYMAPEHLRATDPAHGPNSALVDARSDLFSLGVILFELLTGTHPFGPIPSELSSDEIREFLRERHEAGPRPVRQANPCVDRRLARLIERCLASDPTDRPQSARELAADLRASLSRGRRGRRWVACHRWIVGGGLVLTLAAGAGTGYLAARPDPQLRLHWEAGLAAYDRQQYPEAGANFDWVLRAAPGDPRLSFARGRVSLQQAIECWVRGEDRPDLFDRALADFQAAGSLRDGRVCFCIGLCHTFLSHYPDAITAYQEALGAGFAEPEVINALAYALWGRGEKGDFERALQLLDPVASPKPGLAAAVHYNRAWVRFQQLTRRGEDRVEDPAAVEAMMADIRRAVELTPPDARAVGLYEVASWMGALAAADDDRWDDWALTCARQAVAFGRDPEKLKARLIGFSEKAGLAGVGTALVGFLGAPHGQGALPAAAVLRAGKARQPLFESLPDQGPPHNPARVLRLIDPIAGIPDDLRWQP